MMHFACSRCGHRQEVDASCQACGNDVVQDLRERRARDYLHELESRSQRRKHARYISAGAIAGILVFVASWILIGWIASNHPTGASVRVPLRGGSVAVNDGNAPFFAAALAGLGALAATTTVLELTRGRRRRFPYLDEYDP